MKILFLASSLSAGGAERVLSEMANYWAVRNHQVTIITWFGPPEEPDFYPLHQNIERISLGFRYEKNQNKVRKYLFFFQRIFRLRRIIIDKNPEILISFMDTNNVTTLLASQWIRIRKKIITEHIDPQSVNIGLIWKKLRESLYPQASALIVLTKDSEAWFKTHIPNTKVHLIPNSIKKLPNIKIKKEKIILAVGRLTFQKGFDLLIKAFAQIKDDFPNWNLTILGEGNDRRELENLVNSLGLKNKINMPGRVVDVDIWLARASLVVQPSRFEGFGLAHIEAMGMGCALIATNCLSGPSDFIQDGVNGRLIPVENIETLASVMRELLSDPEQRNRLGNEARKVKEIYSQEKIMGYWASLIIK